MQTELKTHSNELVNQFRRFCLTEGITAEQLAAKTGYKESNIKRIFACEYSPKLDLFLDLVAAADCRVELVKS